MLAMTVQADVEAPGDDLITRIKEVTVINEAIREGLAAARAGKLASRRGAWCAAEDEAGD